MWRRGCLPVLIDIERDCRVSARRKEQGQKYKSFYSGWKSTKDTCNLALGSRDS